MFVCDRACVRTHVYICRAVIEKREDAPEKETECYKTTMKHIAQVASGLFFFLLPYNFSIDPYTLTLQNRLISLCKIVYMVIATINKIKKK